MSYQAILSAPWAIEPAALQEVLERYRAHLATAPAAAPPGIKLREKTRGEYALQGGVAIVAVEGVLMRRPGFFDMLFGAQSLEEIKLDISAALEDPAVKGIVLDINSPGGTVDGSQELARAVYEANARKPVAALANGLMASAAYWIGAAADSVHVSSDTAFLGSIGVLATHFDLSERERMFGIKASDVYAGRYKALGSPHAPLSDVARETMQGQVDYLYTVFVNDVAQFRGVAVGTVRDQMADGRIFIGEQAIAAGLADGRASLAELVGSMNGGALRRRRPIPGASMAGVVAFHGAQHRHETLEERCKRTWDTNPELRGQFGNYFEAYLAEQRLVAEGRIVGGRNYDG
jgi:signal peptide peptidase SppA